MKKSQQKLFKKAQRYLVGGVNSPLRAFKPVGGSPIFITMGQGSRVKDIAGKEYIDYVQGYGGTILGHAHPKVVSAVGKKLRLGSSFGTNTAGEAELAKEICAAYPAVDLMRFTNSGTEAVMGALKLAKAYTGRNKIIKFKECYHGWSEQPYLEAEFNNLDSVKKRISKETAAVIVEPVPGNCGVIPPAPGFLEGLRRLCRQNGVLLIFDEVITGFRLAYGGAQERCGITADLTCFGKIIGGGFPVGAFGGKREIMKLLAPEGPVYQAGTFSGNPVTMAAGLATLRILKNRRIYRELEEKARVLCEGLKFRTCRVGPMFSFVMDNYRQFFWKMMGKGIYFTPSDKETNFISAAHTWKEIEETIRKCSA
ncbi:aminotransferase class III-fold pyridoxal phosphate-dependent enzyme [Candidatus Saganbacteria bacterium]|uniref:Aminotransferase class III-fold pyridoxal phosphate-dependent enzyme n=1 Tax=Candidatus Saganbacteria bacterium TaxID=2575572 RepID=A0A9D6UL85_UNCSA|nr:aminotransferase class III-fold pyridoxal phosphate-dependent enzyme [Candidatus Saganbacteria bacterium]